MTTTTDPTALLAEAAAKVWIEDVPMGVPESIAQAILAASPTLARALAIGTTWLAAEVAATHEGILGWSNKRAGVEFYHSWEDGRWGRRPGGYAEGEPERGGWGHLLADDIESALGHAEGRPVLVIVGERSASAATALTALADALRKERGA